MLRHAGKKGQCSSLSAAMLTANAQQAQIAKRMQLSRDQKALLEKRTATTPESYSTGVITK